MTRDHDPNCFIIMPFTVAEADLSRYSGDRNHWTEVYKGLIVPAVRSAGLHCERSDEDVTTRLIAETVWRKIEEADVVLCDLSAHNPNVHLELGWALRADKRFVLIKDELTQFNFDLNQFHTYQYSHRLQPTALKRAVSDLADALRATLADNERQYSLVSKLALRLRAVTAARDGNVEVDLLRELLAEVRRTSREDLGAKTTSPRYVFSDIREPADLAEMLPGTTWRKKNDLEHLIFAAEGRCYNNHAGHAHWRENTYKVSDQVGTMTVQWSVDGVESTCRFNAEFNEFVEEENPEGIWFVVARQPHTPGWGV